MYDIKKVTLWKERRRKGSEKKEVNRKKKAIDKNSAYTVSSL